MAGVPTPEYEKYWQTEAQSLREQCKNLIQEYPDAEGSIIHVYNIINDIIAIAACTPASVGNSEAWNDMAENAKKRQGCSTRGFEGKETVILSGPV
jgi:hypothetical protein